MKHRLYCIITILLCTFFSCERFLTIIRFKPYYEENYNTEFNDLIILEGVSVSLRAKNMYFKPGVTLTMQVLFQNLGKDELIINTRKVMLHSSIFEYELDMIRNFGFHEALINDTIHLSPNQTIDLEYKFKSLDNEYFKKSNREKYYSLYTNPNKAEVINIILLPDCLVTKNGEAMIKDSIKKSMKLFIE